MVNRKSVNDKGYRRHTIRKYGSRSIKLLQLFEEEWEWEEERGGRESWEEDERKEEEKVEEG